MDVVSRFAVDTRHKEKLDQSNGYLIAKKFLATQSPLADWSDVYPFVCSDLQRIEFRAPGQLDRWANGVEIPAKTFELLLNDAKVDFSKYAVVKDYIEKVDPPKGKELTTLFLHGQKNKNLYEHDIDPKLHERILLYSPDPSFNKKQIAREIGTLIRNIELPLSELELVDCDSCGGKNRKVEEEDPEERYDGARAGMNLEDHVQTEWLAQHERELRGNPVMQAFKKDNHLATQFPSIKAAKQLILSEITPKDNHQALLNDIMGKRQTEIKKTFTQEVMEPDHWNHLLTIVDSFSPETIDAIVNTSQCQRFARFQQGKINDKTSLVKALLTEHSPYASTDTKRNKRYKDKELSPEIVQLIITA